MRPIPRQPLTASALGAAFALFASPAFAADVGWCGTPEEMSALMREEGQRSLAVGNQIIHFERDADGSLHAIEPKQAGVIFTAHPDGSVGYLIQADQPIGTPATSSCITLRIHDVRLYDARVPGIPPEALVDSTEDAALARCLALYEERIAVEGRCFFHNILLQGSVILGDGVLLQGYGAVRRLDGAYVAGESLVTVTFIERGNGRKPNGDRSPDQDRHATILFTALPEGAAVLQHSTLLVDATYTKQAIDMLESRDDGVPVGALLLPR